MNENMNANSVKLPLVVRIALWLWIVTSLGGAIYCFIFEGEVDYKEPLRVFDEVLILGSIGMKHGLLGMRLLSQTQTMMTKHGKMRHKRPKVL